MIMIIKSEFAHMYMPKNPMISPKTDRSILPGRLLGNPISASMSCAPSVIIMLDEPMVAVRDAPILLRPVEYDIDPMDGNSENNIDVTIMNVTYWLYTKSNVSMNILSVNRFSVLSNSTGSVPSSFKFIMKLGILIYVNM